MSERVCVIILSPHRSGSSTVAGTLADNGVNFGEELLKPASDNKKGFFENPHIVKLNEDILESFGYSWFNNGELPDKWWLKKSHYNFADRACDIVMRDLRDGKLVGIKDPRLSLLCPFWIYILRDKLNFNLRFAIILREPSEIIASISNRNGFTPEHSGFLTLQYLTAIIRNCKEGNPFVISFNRLLTNFNQEMSGLAHDLGLNLPLDKTFLDEKLINHSNIKLGSVDSNITLLKSIYEFILSNRSVTNRLDLTYEKLDLIKVDQSKITPANIKTKEGRYKLGLGLFSSLFRNPLKFTRNINRDNYRKLLKAIKDETPNTIIENLEK